MYIYAITYINRYGGYMEVGLRNHTSLQGTLGVLIQQTRYVYLYALPSFVCNVYMICIFIYTYIYIYTYAHIYIYIHIYIYLFGGVKPYQFLSSSESSGC